MNPIRVGDAALLVGGMTLGAFASGGAIGAWQRPDAHAPEAPVVEWTARAAVPLMLVGGVASAGLLGTAVTGALRANHSPAAAVAGGVAAGLLGAGALVGAGMGGHYIAMPEHWPTAA